MAALIEDRSGRYPFEWKPETISDRDRLRAEGVVDASGKMLNLLMLLGFSQVGAAATPPAKLRPQAQIYCDQAELLRLLPSAFEPGDWVDGEPRSVTLLGASRIRLFYGQDGGDCSFSPASKDHWTVACEGLPPTIERWEQRPDGSVLTTLLAEPGQTITLRTCVVPDISSLRLDFERRYASAHWPSLLGAWVSREGGRLRVTREGGEGHVTVADVQSSVLLRRCVFLQSSAEVRRPCLVFRGPNDSAPKTMTSPPRRVLVLFEHGCEVAHLREGTISTDVGYYPVEFGGETRKFYRAR